MGSFHHDDDDDHNDVDDSNEDDQVRDGDHDQRLIDWFNSRYVRFRAILRISNQKADFLKEIGLSFLMLHS